MNRLSFVIGIVIIMVFASCKPGTPEQYIQPAEMEDLLVDIHIARAMARDAADRNMQTELLLESALRKHGVTREQFDSSLVYYYTRADRFDDIYARVSKRLEDQALALGATEGEIGKFSSLNADGDTANIWPGSRMLVMMPAAPYNRVDFVLEADSTAMVGDTYLLQFMADFVYQSGTKDCQIYVAIELQDTAIVRQMRCTYSGLSQLRMESLPKKPLKRINGFMYLASNMEATSSQRLLFINNIQLIRFHHHEAAKSPAVQADSIKPVTNAARATVVAAGSGDKVGKGSQVVSSGKRAPANRMVQRIDSVKARH